MYSKFDKLINEYISGTQDTIPQANYSVSPFAGVGSIKPPDTGTGMGQTKNLKKALSRDKIKKNKNEKQLRKINKQL